jgi:hypothetical protein
MGGPWAVLMVKMIEAVWLTDSQQAAMKWLKEHNGDGLFGKDGVLVAGGERAPFMRMTWNTLRDKGLVEFYMKKRVRLANLVK